MNKSWRHLMQINLHVKKNWRDGNQNTSDGRKTTTDRFPNDCVAETHTHNHLHEESNPHINQQQQPRNASAFSLSTHLQVQVPNDAVHRLIHHQRFLEQFLQAFCFSM